MRRRVPVAQHRAAAACEHRCHPAPRPGECRVADEIHLRVPAMQAADLEAVADLTVAEAEFSKLPVGHRAVLASGELGDRVVRVRWCTHTVHEVTRTANSPPRARPSPDYPGPSPAVRTPAPPRRRPASAGPRSRRGPWCSARARCG